MENVERDEATMAAAYRTLHQQEREKKLKEAFKDPAYQHIKSEIQRIDVKMEKLQKNRKRLTVALAAMKEHLEDGIDD